MTARNEKYVSVKRDRCISRWLVESRAAVDVRESITLSDVSFQCKPEGGCGGGYDGWAEGRVDPSGIPPRNPIQVIYDRYTGMFLRGDNGTQVEIAKRLHLRADGSATVELLDEPTA